MADGPDASSALTTANGNVPRNNGAGRDSETFGAAPTGAWDQFEANARLFGTKTSWAEEIYTTKLNRSGPDYKKKEKEADRLASEIMGVSVRLATLRPARADSVLANRFEPSHRRRKESDGKW